MTTDEGTASRASQVRDAGPPAGGGPGDYRIALEVVAGASVVAGVSLLGRMTPFPAAVILFALALELALGVLAVRRWRLALPMKAPLYRIAVVTVALVLISVIQLSGGRALEGDPALLVAVTLLALPAGVGHELFFRGSLYSLVLDRRGPATAVLVSSAASTMVVVPTGGAYVVAFALVREVIFGLSRATTGSLAPAIAARVLLGLAGVGLALLAL